MARDSAIAPDRGPQADSESSPRVVVTGAVLSPGPCQKHGPGAGPGPPVRAPRLAET